ncbi:3383_t:CDS:2, partial [Acaulospora colombiana]
GALHGDMMQLDRDKVLKDFKNNKFPIMVATDVAARGLDIKAVKTVINYDIARDIDSHVHRIGRTGRAGEKGTAYTLITEKEDKFAGDLVRNLESSGQTVPDALMNLAMKVNRAPHFFNVARGSVGSSSNAIPLGGRSGIGSGAQIPPPPQLDTSTSGRGNSGSTASRFQMSFQKASSAESGLGLLRSSSSASQPSTNTQRKRRWDS